MRVQAEVYSCFIANQPVATSLPRSHGGRANSNRRTGRALMEARTNLVAAARRTRPAAASIATIASLSSRSVASRAACSGLSLDSKMVPVVAHHLATSGLHGEEDEWPGFGLTFGQEESTLRVG
jgi:hypothetical protein